MSLFSLRFIINVCVLSVIYFVIPKRFQWLLLLIFSYVFYLYADFKSVVYILCTTISTFTAGLLLEWIDKNAEKILKEEQDNEEKKIILKNTLSKKRFVVTAAVLLNVGILSVMKYSNFFIQNINIIFQNFHLNNHFEPLDIILPLGISFYTFQSIGYVLDVYRGKVQANRNILKYALFISYFPQIIQGPIGRYSDLYEQFFEKHSFNYQQFKSGALRMLWGYFLKMVIADRAAIMVNEVFNNYLEMNYKGLVVFIGVFFYGVQIYADFSGGIDIVCGLSEILGIRLAENFRNPFMAKSVSEYWLRWHITLGTWMRDYLFYPLALSKGFNKLGKKAKKIFGNNIGKLIPGCLASFIIFLLIGIWHGASWKYIIYGLYHATLVSTASLLEPIYCKVRTIFRINENSFAWRTFQTLRTVFLVTIGRYFSRALSARWAFGMLNATFSVFNPWIFWDNSLYQIGLNVRNFWLLVILTIFMFIIDSIKERGIVIRKEIAKQHIVIRWMIYYAAIFAIMIFGIYGTEYNAASFIYQGF